MAAGEYAVHPSTSSSSSATHVCFVFPTLEDAVCYAGQQAALQPAVRFRVYGHEGFTGAPVREIRGAQYRDRDEISPRFRRWLGSILFFGGVVLTFADWRIGFRSLWPSMLGTRMVMPGAMLLFIEAMVLLHARKARHS